MIKFGYSISNISAISNPHLEVLATDLKNSHMKEWESESGTECVVSDYFVFIGIIHHLQRQRKQVFTSFPTSSFLEISVT